MNRSTTTAALLAALAASTLVTGCGSSAHAPDPMATVLPSTSTATSTQTTSTGTPATSAASAPATSAASAPATSAPAPSTSTTTGTGTPATSTSTVPSTSAHPGHPGHPGHAMPVPHVKPRKPLRTVAITFDDGPGTATHRVLALLAKLKVPATFFIIADQAKADPAPVRAEVAAGQCVQVHDWDHTHQLSLMSTSFTTSDAERSAALLRTLGAHPTLMRPPYGASDPKVHRAIAAAGLSEVEWDVDSEDWRRPGSATIVRNATTNQRTNQFKKDRIVLFHDGGGDRSQTLAALPQVIAWYRAHGYTFVQLGCTK